jgi:hypothetical protein
MALLDDHAKALADAIDLALPAWVIRSVDGIYRVWSGQPSPPAILAAAADAGREARADVGTRVRDLLTADIDQQPTTPLALLRSAVRYPTAVLVHAGVPPVERDADDEDRFPDDLYGLTPASLADLTPSLLELGLAWGAAKAWTHKHRHGGVAS